MFWQSKLIEGIIYDASLGLTSGEVVIVIQRDSAFRLAYNGATASWERLRQSDVTVSAIRGVGAGLIITSASGVVLATYPILSSEVGYRLSQAKKLALSPTQAFSREEQLENLKILAVKDMEEREQARKFAQEVGITDTNFSVYIPKINAKARVVQNVDPADPKAYTNALKQGIAHAWGSAIPGEGKGIYLFAHSTNGPWNVSQYNAVFYLLRELKPEENDSIYVFSGGKLSKYKVAEKHITEAHDVSWLENAGSGPERLILQTCWPPGTIWKRLIVVAHPEKTDLIPQSSGQVQPVYGGV